MPEHVIHASGKRSAIRSHLQHESSATRAAVAEVSTQTLTSTISRSMCAPLVRVVDQVALITAVVLSLLSSEIRAGESFQHFLSLRISMRNLLLQAGLLIVWRSMFWVTGSYQPRLNPRMTTLLWRVPLTTALCSGVFCPLLLWARPSDEAFRSCLLFWFISTSLMLLTRSGVMVYEGQIRPATRTRRTVLICGTGGRARSVLLGLPSNRDYKYQLAGFIDDRMQLACARFGKLVGTVDDLESILMRQPIDEVIVALPIKSRFEQIEQIVETCGRAGIQIQYPMLNLENDIAKRRSTTPSDEDTRVTLEMVHNDHRLLLKSAFDRTAAGVGLFLLSPVLLAIAISIKLGSKGPVFFVQKRFGLNKRTFGMIKFRSMVTDAEAQLAALEKMNESDGPTFKMKRDPRITRVGAFIRRTSLDELPQLINVLKGDMSLVGPRPLPLRDVERFSEPWLMRRFSVKPGITGLWQVSGRSNTAFSQAIKLDLSYIDHWSLMMDLKILARTLSAVIRSDGAY